MTRENDAATHFLLLPHMAGLASRSDRMAWSDSLRVAKVPRASGLLGSAKRGGILMQPRLRPALCQSAMCTLKNRQIEIVRVEYAKTLEDNRHS
jgi:hypothetical protein